MSFENAHVTKGLMLGLALTSIAAGVFDVNYYLHLQLVPHISRYHQYWRLFTHHIACANSSDLLLVELLLYNAGVHIERAFGSVKYASFILMSAALSTILTFVAMLILHTSSYLGSLFNYVPCGPMAVIFGLVYQYRRLVPAAYLFRVFGVELDDKVFIFALAFQLTISYAPSTLFLTAIGFFSGYLYRSDLFSLKQWRVPHNVCNYAATYLKPLLGENEAIRRSNRVIPLPRSSEPTEASAPPDEPITTAREGAAPSSPADANEAPPAESANARPRQNTTSGVVRQFMSELTGPRPGTAGAPRATVRAPGAEEIQTLVGMFPDVDRDIVVGVLQQSPNIEAAAETLLSSQR